MPHERVAQDPDGFRPGPGDTEVLGLPVYQRILQVRGGDTVLFHVYFDGVPISGGARTNKDSIICFYYTPVHLLGLGIQYRRLFTVMAKSMMCKCGCRGRCTILAIERRMMWSMAALREKKYPSIGPDREPLTGWRCAVAGQALPIKGSLGSLGCDWEARSFGGQIN